MAIIIGKTGKSARMLAEKREKVRKFTLLTVLVMIPLLFMVYLWLNHQVHGFVASTVLFVLMVIVYKFLDRYACERDRHFRKGILNAEQGALGEDAVGKVLNSLPNNFYVVHALAKLNGDIDHIVVGPTGVFVIETKANKGHITTDGKKLYINGFPPEKDFLKQSKQNAFWIHDVLKNIHEIKLWVTPVLVFTSAQGNLNRRISGVQVVNQTEQLKQAILRARKTDVPIEIVVNLLMQKMGISG